MNSVLAVAALWAAAAGLALLAAAALRTLTRPETGRHCACDARGLPRPTHYPRHDGSIVIVGADGDVRVRPVNGRYLGTMPRLTTPDAPPWDVSTARQPALVEREDCKRDADDDAPVFGEAPVATVLEAEAHPAGPDAGYPCCVHCGDELDHLIHAKPCCDGCNGPTPYALALGPDGCEEA